MTIYNDQVWWETFLTPSQLASPPNNQLWCKHVWRNPQNEEITTQTGGRGSGKRWMTKSSCWQTTKKLECLCYFGLGNKQKAYRQFRGVPCYFGVLSRQLRYLWLGNVSWKLFGYFHGKVRRACVIFDWKIILVTLRTLFVEMFGVLVLSLIRQ